MALPGSFAAPMAVPAWRLYPAETDALLGRSQQPRGQQALVFECLESQSQVVNAPPAPHPQHDATGGSLNVLTHCLECRTLIRPLMGHKARSRYCRVDYRVLVDGAKGYCACIGRRDHGRTSGKRRMVFRRHVPMVEDGWEPSHGAIAAYREMKRRSVGGAPPRQPLAYASTHSPAAVVAAAYHDGGLLSKQYGNYSSDHYRSDHHPLIYEARSPASHFHEEQHQEVSSYYHQTSHQSSHHEEVAPARIPGSDLPPKKRPFLRNPQNPHHPTPAAGGGSLDLGRRRCFPTEAMPDTPSTTTTTTATMRDYQFLIEAARRVDASFHLRHAALVGPSSSASDKDGDSLSSPLSSSRSSLVANESSSYPQQQQQQQNQNNDAHLAAAWADPSYGGVAQRSSFPPSVAPPVSAPGPHHHHHHHHLLLSTGAPVSYDDEPPPPPPPPPVTMAITRVLPAETAWCEEVQVEVDIAHMPPEATVARIVVAVDFEGRSKSVALLPLPRFARGSRCRFTTLDAREQLFYDVIHKDGPDAPVIHATCTLYFNQPAIPPLTAYGALCFRNKASSFTSSSSSSSSADEQEDGTKIHLVHSSDTDEAPPPKKKKKKMHSPAPPPSADNFNGNGDGDSEHKTAAPLMKQSAASILASLRG